MNRDLENLKLLSIFHYALAGIMAFFACFPVIHLIVGLFLIFAPLKMGPNGEVPPAFVGWLIVIFSAFFILSGLTMAAFIAITGRYLSQQKRHIFCIVVAAIECTFTPLGTVLGVFTIIVLTRDSVKELFAANEIKGVRTIY